MTRKDYFIEAEHNLDQTKTIEDHYLYCYNRAIDNKDTENAKWFGNHIIGAINQRWINHYVRPTGMLDRR
jgi:hypothetical protein